MVRQSNNLRNRRSRPCSLLEGTAPRAAVILLLTAALLVGGCAAVRGSQGGPGREDPPPAAHQSEKLPFPVSPRMAPLEPTVVSYPNYRDPLIWVNRGIFAFNDVTYRYLLIPLGKGYVRVVPDPVRQGRRQLLLQPQDADLRGEPPAAAQAQTLGAGPAPLRHQHHAWACWGCFDPAKAWFGLQREETHFDATLSPLWRRLRHLPGAADLRPLRPARTAPPWWSTALLNPVYLPDRQPRAKRHRGLRLLPGLCPGSEALRNPAAQERRSLYLLPQPLSAGSSAGCRLLERLGRLLLETILTRPASGAGPLSARRRPPWAGRPGSSGSTPRPRPC